MNSGGEGDQGGNPGKENHLKEEVRAERQENQWAQN